MNQRIARRTDKHNYDESEMVHHKVNGTDKKTHIEEEARTSVAPHETVQNYVLLDVTIDQATPVVHY